MGGPNASAGISGSAGHDDPHVIIPAQGVAITRGVVGDSGNGSAAGQSTKRRQNRRPSTYQTVEEAEDDDIARATQSDLRTRQETQIRRQQQRLKDGEEDEEEAASQPKKRNKKETRIVIEQPQAYAKKKETSWAGLLLGACGLGMLAWQYWTQSTDSTQPQLNRHQLPAGLVTAEQQQAQVTQAQDLAQQVDPVDPPASVQESLTSVADLPSSLRNPFGATLAARPPWL